jgi:hypothetical protein
MTSLEFKVLGFFPADHAAAVDGKVYVNGGFWNMLRFQSFPHVMPTFSLVAVLEVPYRAYHEDHKVTLSMEDTDRHPQGLQVEGVFRVGTEPHMRVGDPTVLPFAINVNNVTFERPGDFVFKLEVDGTEMTRYGFRVVQVVGGLPMGAAPPSEGAGDEDSAQ